MLMYDHFVGVKYGYENVRVHQPRPLADFPGLGAQLDRLAPVLASPAYFNFAVFEAHKHYGESLKLNNV